MTHRGRCQCDSHCSFSLGFLSPSVVAEIEMTTLRRVFSPLAALLFTCGVLASGSYFLLLSATCHSAIQLPSPVLLPQHGTWTLLRPRQRAMLQIALAALRRDSAAIRRERGRCVFRSGMFSRNRAFCFSKLGRIQHQFHSLPNCWICSVLMAASVSGVPSSSPSRSPDTTARAHKLQIRPVIQLRAGAMSPLLANMARFATRSA